MRAAALPASSRAPAASRPLLWLLCPPLLLAVTLGALLVLVPPLGEFPVEDDWLYARAVQSILERGQLEVPAWTASSLVFHAYWGALFSHLLGFSHLALRVSTLVLAALGAFACYALLRQLLNPLPALTGTLLLVLNPIYVTLSYSFMTDIPFLCLALWSMAAYVRALRAQRPSPSWLAVGSALAGGAYLVRQLGLGLPMATLIAIGLVGGWRAALRPRILLTLGLPLVPAMLLGGYFDAQRGPVHEEPLGWTIAFWVENGAGMIGVVLARLAGTLSTLGMFTLPVWLGGLRWSAIGLSRAWQRWLAGGLIISVGIGFIVRTSAFGLSPLFPHLRNVLSARGLFVNSSYYSGTLPESIALPDAALVVITLASVLGAAFLIVAAVSLMPSRSIRGPLAIPLAFSVLALVQALTYHQFFDRYVLVLLPAASTLCVLGFWRDRVGQALVVAGVATLACWSVWWQRDYLDRRVALWQAAQALVERGVQPDQIDGGYEWNGWYRGQEILAAAVQQALTTGSGSGNDLINLLRPSPGGRPVEPWRQVEKFVLDSLRSRTPRWAVVYSPPRDARAGTVLATVPYGSGQHVYAIQRS